MLCTVRRIMKLLFSKAVAQCEGTERWTEASRRKGVVSWKAEIAERLVPSSVCNPADRRIAREPAACVVAYSEP